MKPKIYASGNSNLGEYNVSYYIVEKDEDFLGWLGKGLFGIGCVTSPNFTKSIEKPVHDEKGKEIDVEIIPKNVKTMVDVHEHYESKEGERVDVYYGQSRVYINLRKLKSSRDKFGKYVLETREWLEVKQDKVDNADKKDKEDKENKENKEENKKKEIKKNEK